MLVGQSSGNTPFGTSKGIVTPKSGNIRINDIRFYNFGAGTKSLVTCAGCDSPSSFSNLGMWKLKNKLWPKERDPPMAKFDERGNLLSCPEGLKKLYLRHYDPCNVLNAACKISAFILQYCFEV